MGIMKSFTTCLALIFVLLEPTSCVKDLNDRQGTQCLSNSYLPDSPGITRYDLFLYYYQGWEGLCNPDLQLPIAEYCDIPVNSIWFYESLPGGSLYCGVKIRLPSTTDRACIQKALRCIAVDQSRTTIPDCMGMFFRSASALWYA